MKAVIAFLLFAAIALSIPESYDFRKEVPECEPYIRNQGQCGSCWAFSATTCMSARFCFASKKAMKPILSPQYIVNCNTFFQSGCNGGRMTGVFDYMRSSGCPDEKCVAYYSGTTKKEGPCPKKCDDGSSLKFFYGTKSYSLPSRNVQKMQEDIINYGPVTVGFRVFDDFKPFFATNKTGIYHYTKGKLLGGHGVVIVGWGEEKGEKYWIVHNSWGPEWGDKGYFRIRRGTDECGIESMMVCAGLPKVENPPSYALPLNHNGMMLNEPSEIEVSDDVFQIALEGMMKVFASNKESRKMLGVKRARVQVVAGFNYFFDIELEGGRVADLVVYEDPQGERHITHFM